MSGVRRVSISHDFDRFNLYRNFTFKRLFFFHFAINSVAYLEGGGCKREKFLPAENFKGRKGLGKNVNTFVIRWSICIVFESQIISKTNKKWIETFKLGATVDCV